jgi:hypothetical protein
MHFLPANRLRLYRNFKAIEVNDFHGVVRFYERFEDAIRILDFEEYLDCTLTYANALFETAQYGKHVVMCDHLLEQIIMQNIETWGGVDIFAKTLHDKAISLFYRQEYAESEHVLRELVKIYPWGYAYLRLLFKCLMRQKPSWLMTVRAVSIVFFLFSLLLIVLQMFTFNHFYPQSGEVYSLETYLSLGGSLTLLLCGETLHTWRCHRQVHQLAGAARSRKKMRHQNVA